MRIFLFLAPLFLLTACGSEDTGGITDGLNSEEHRIFVTSVSYNGLFDSDPATALTIADSYCKSAKNSVNLKRTYKAVISNSSSTAANRLTITGAIYIFTSNSNKNLVAANSADFWGTGSKNLLNNVNRDEKFTLLTGVTPWTGTNSDGSEAFDTCSNWSSASAGTNGQRGSTDSLSDAWIEGATANCSATHPIVCISQ